MLKSQISALYLLVLRMHIPYYRMYDGMYVGKSMPFM